MDRPVNRIPPQLPVHAMRTYSVDAPRATHWRDATCAEVDCEAWRSGWLTIVDERPETVTELGARQAAYIRGQSGRSYVEARDGQTGHTVFDFAAGQTCFSRHRVRLDRLEVYRVRGGDFRGNPTGENRVHDAPEHWLEDFAEHQQQLQRRIGG